MIIIIQEVGEKDKEEIRAEAMVMMRITIIRETLIQEKALAV